MSVDTRPRCMAEVGTYGAWHSCPRAASYACVTHGGTRLAYCASHTERAGTERYTGPLKEDPTPLTSRHLWGLS